MAARSSNVAWRGAIEFSGFPVNIMLYSRARKSRTESFKNIAPSGNPMMQGDPVDPATGQTFSNDLMRKGVQVGSGKNARYVVLSGETIEAIKEGQKTTVAKPDQFCPLETLALDLAIDRYAVRPDDKVAGSEQSTNIIWNGLRKSGLAYVSQVTFTAGGLDSILVIYADDNGLWGTLLPFEDELYEIPNHDFKVDEKAEKLFAQVVKQQHKVEPFNHGQFVSQYKTRRAKLIDAAIAGEPVPVDATPEAPAEMPDLMSILEQAVAA